VTRLGECYERLSLSFDRDQDYTLKAIEKYRYVINRFPASSYTKIADERLKGLEQKLADRELYIGEFYYKTYQYNASIIRLEYFLKRYPKAMGTEKALYYLSQSYWHLGNIEKGERYFEVLKIDYPKSIYARAPTMKTTRQRRSLKLAKAKLPAISPEERRPREIELRPEGFQVARREDKKADEIDLFDKTKPIDIVSDTMEGFDEEKYVVFKGNVVAKQEDLYIFSDIIEAHVDAETNEIEKAYAKGNVKIVKRERTATCNEALFDNREGTIVLKGNVIVYSGTDRLTGDTVTYYVDEDRVVVQGAKDYKARIKITPK
jgi:lipopolysaccharide transport protein LptA